MFIMHVFYKHTIAQTMQVSICVCCSVILKLLRLSFALPYVVYCSTEHRYPHADGLSVRSRSV